MTAPSARRRRGAGILAAPLLVLALGAPLACSGEADGEVPEGGAVDVTTADEAAEEVDVEAIPSQDAADAYAEETIDETNADEEFERLRQQIETEDG